MSSHPLRVNRTPASVDAWDPDTPLLYALRNGLVLHGAKFGCGLGQCVCERLSGNAVFWL